MLYAALSEETPQRPRGPAAPKKRPTSYPRPRKAKVELPNDTVELPDNHTIQEKWIKCGKADCQSCPHGPYLYAQWYEDGKTKSKYLGKK